MNFKILKKDITKALSVISGVSEGKTIEYASHVLIQAEEGAIKLTTTDTQTWITTTVKTSNYETGGVATANAKQLADLCRLLPNETEIHFRYDAGSLRVEANTSEYFLATLSSEGFPLFEDHEEVVELEISAPDFKTVIDKTSIAIGRPMGRDKGLDGLCIDINDGKLVSMATDISFLAAAYLEVQNSSNIQAIASRKAISQISKLITDYDNHFVLKVSSSAITVQGEDFKLTSLLINGPYPHSASSFINYMPPGESHSVEINPKSFSEALSRISLIAQDGKEVGMVFSDGKEKEKKENEPMFAKGITLVGRNRKDKGSELYETQYTGKEDVPLAFDITYFQQALSFIDSDTCSFEIFGSDAACIITSNDKHNVKYCIMPLLQTPSTATK